VKSAREPLRGLRVLVVEDHGASRAALEAVLRIEGADIATAASVAEARTALAQNRPDVILSDINMPGEDGCAFIRSLRESERKIEDTHLPAVALTAYANPSDRQRVLAAGFDEHVAKPIDFERLVATLGALARGARARVSGEGEGQPPRRPRYATRDAARTARPAATARRSRTSARAR
jgi:CheY-like chemotaxis protein